MIRLAVVSLILFSFPSEEAIQKLYNPILPINLDATRIIVSKHTFVSYINVTELLDMKQNLDTQLRFIIENQNVSNQSDLLIQQAKTISTQIDHQLQIINPHVIFKRGLINLGGKVSKWLFGTLDNEDGERINTILNHLEKNDHILEDAINNQIHMAKEFMVQTNRTLFQIKANILTTMNLINTFQDEINEINVLHLIINSLINLQNQLNQIINALTFANLNKIHPTFLSLNNLNTLIDKMKTLYIPNQIVDFKSQYSYYNYLGIQLLFSNKRIVFLIHFPILSPLLFRTYFIYPIPLQNRVILPLKPYLILNEKTEIYQYQDEPCAEIEDVYYCKNKLQTEEDCIVRVILKNQADNCSILLVHIDRAIANQVTPESIILTAPADMVITESCSIETHHEVESGSFLITIPEGCYFVINEEKFMHGIDELSPMTVIKLPSLNISTLSTKNVKMKLNKMDLEEIQHLTSKMNTHHEVVLPMEPTLEQSLPVWMIALICLIACLAIYILVTCYYKTCYPYNLILYLQQRRRNRENAAEVVTLNGQPSQPDQP